MTKMYWDKNLRLYSGLRRKKRKLLWVFDFALYPKLILLYTRQRKRETETETERVTGSGKREMRLAIYHEILHSERIEGGEFIDDNSFLWFLTPSSAGTCHLSGHSFGRKSANDSILMKFRNSTQSEGGEFNSDNSFLGFSTPVNFYTCQYWHMSSFRP